MLLLYQFVVFNIFFNLVTTFPFGNNNDVESQGRRIEKRDINYSFLTHTGLPETAGFWMYMAICALIYLIITAFAYTITSIFCRPKKEEYPVREEKVKSSTAVAVRSRADNTTSASLEVKIDTQSAGDYSSYSSAGRPPSSLISSSEREQDELRKMRTKMKTAKGEFVSARHSTSELQLVEELNAELKASATGSSNAKTAKSKSRAATKSSTESKGTTSTSTSGEEEEEEETSTSGSSSEKSESDEVYNLDGHNAESSKFGSGSESDSNELSK
uniref:Uncharacterized protein n=2 Tax=Meloidogyne TaxID=189290 RepID=A0A6V7V4Z3_MELEN|nr:unnamed protein product [Meloidogyne enterolobii]